MNPAQWNRAIRRGPHVFLPAVRTGMARAQYVRCRAILRELRPVGPPGAAPLRRVRTPDARRVGSASGVNNSDRTGGSVGRPGDRPTEQILTILQLLVARPNRRAEPLAGDVDPDAPHTFWFDGGACSENTGSTDYLFADGTTARVTSPSPWFRSVIRFPNGGSSRSGNADRHERPGQLVAKHHEDHRTDDDGDRLRDGGTGRGARDTAVPVRGPRPGSCRCSPGAVSLRARRSRRSWEGRTTASSRCSRQRPGRLSGRRRCCPPAPVARACSRPRLGPAHQGPFRECCSLSWL